MSANQRREYIKMQGQMPKPADPLDEFAAADPKAVMALMLWKARLREPDLFVQITEKDLEGFHACMRYLKVIPDVRIHRPQGLPATPAVPATAHRSAIPAREATPPKPFVMVTLVEKGTDNGIRPVEDNQDDFEASELAVLVRKASDNAQTYADRIVNAANSGEFSLSEMRDAAEALLILARAQR